MTLYSALRNATLLAAAAVLGVSTAFAIDPARAPRSVDPIVPNPQDPYGTYPLTPGGQFDPFAPTPGLGTQGLGGTFPAAPAGGALDYRVNPSVAPNPEQPAQPARWRLGVFSTDTGTGVQIVRVREGSPAAAAGLEPDDTIVTVSGYQVGYVHNHRHELGQAFNDYADADGYVNMLVHDNRSGNLINLAVTLESRFERIQGTIGFQLGAARLPANAQANIALHEIVREGVIVPLVTETVTDLRQMPIPFALDVDPSLIDPRRQYVVHADITAGTRTLYTTRSAYRVLSSGYPRTVDMRLYPTSTTVGTGTGYTGYADNREEQLDQIVQWFREYLNRDPRLQERDVWQSHIDRGGSLDDARASLLANNEFYTRAGQDEQRYIENMYMAVLGRRPQQAEVDAWLQRLRARNGLRSEIAREFLEQVSKQR